MSKAILYIVNVDWFFQSHRLPIAMAAKECGYEIHIACSFSKYRSDFEALGFILHPIDISRSSNSLACNLKIFFRMMKIIQEVKPRIAHLITIKPVLLGGIAARILGIPSVVFAISGLGVVFSNNGFAAYFRKFVVLLLYRVVFRHKNFRIIFQNDNDKLMLQSILKDNNRSIRMIHGSGVDLNIFNVKPIPENDCVVMLAARLLCDKGIFEFVDAARIILGYSNYRRKVKFVLVGDVDLDNPNSVSKKQLQEWVQEGCIEHWGFCSDMAMTIPMASIIVLPSYYGEGLPKILIEAAACGRVIVTTNHPGCRDAIIPGETGVIVPIKDSKALSVAIKGLLDNPELCVSMGKNGRHHAEKSFDIGNVVAEHIEIYEELIVDSVHN